MVEGAIDFCNLDASWSGGTNDGGALPRPRSPYSVSLAHHEDRRSPRTCSSQPRTGRPSSLPPHRDPIWWTGSRTDRRWSTARLALPDGPGLGWELDNDYLEAHRVTRPA